MARDFSGTTDRVVYASAFNTTSQPLTVSAWVWFNVANQANSQYIWQSAAVGGTFGCAFFQIGGADRQLAFQRAGSTALNFQTATSAFSINTWHHVCASHNGSTGAGSASGAQIYINGVAVGSAIQDLAGETTTNSGFQIGARTSDNLRNFNGRIAEVAVWNRVLTAAEVEILVRGYAPDRLPRLLRFYVPLIRETNEARQGMIGTVTGTTVIDHPRIIRRRPRRWIPVLIGGGAADLTIADATHAHTTDAVALTQDHVLTIADATHAHAADNVAITQQHQLTASDASHTHAADNVTITQQHQLAAADGAHAHTADAIDLTQAHQLAVADSAHAHTADNVVLSTAGDLAVSDSTHAHTAESPTLTQLHVLAVANATHAQAADNVSLSSESELGIADGAHAHAVDNVTLTQQHQLTVADAIHGHAADNVTLTEGTVFAIDEAFHAHTAENVVLEQQHVLAVAGALHAHTADNVTIFASGGVLLTAIVSDAAVNDCIVSDAAVA